jgi:hypothetical protein
MYTAVGDFRHKQMGMVTVCCRGRVGEIFTAVMYVSVNPLTPELNPSAQRYMTRFFTGILLLEP